MISNKHFLTEFYENTNKLGELVDDFEKWIKCDCTNKPNDDIILVNYFPEEFTCFQFKLQILMIFGWQWLIKLRPKPVNLFDSLKNEASKAWNLCERNPEFQRIPRRTLIPT